jgi:hypothetical protein
MPHRHPRPRDVILDELKRLALHRHGLVGELTHLDKRINRLLDDLTEIQRARQP